MFTWHERLEAGSDHGVEWAFTDRWGGSSLPPYGELNLALHVGDRPEAVQTNRHRLAHALGLRLADLRFMDQRHGAEVALTRGSSTAAGDGPAGGAAPPEVGIADPPPVDALISDRTDEALVVMVADCAPVLLADRKEGLVAVVHAGRPGLLAGVVTRAVQRLRDLGAGHLEAVVGPSVCSRCYEVPAGLREAAAAVVPAAAAVSWTGTPAVDVAGGVVQQLADLDVQTRWLPGCTREDADLFSYRRDGRTGRFVGVVRLLPSQRVA